MKVSAKHDELVDLVDMLGWPQPSPATCKRAAQALTDLQAELDGLREALQDIERAVPMGPATDLRSWLDLASALKITASQALSQHPHDSLGGR